MKKFILSLLLPFLMVMGAFAIDFDGETDYEYDDVVVEFCDNEDGTFCFTITNDSYDDIFVNYEDSFFFGVDEDGEEATEHSALFDDDDLDDYDLEDEFFVIEADDAFTSGDIDVSEDSDGNWLEGIAVCLYIEIDGEQYAWTVGAAEAY